MRLDATLRAVLALSGGRPLTVHARGKVYALPLVAESPPPPPPDPLALVADALLARDVELREVVRQTAMRSEALVGAVLETAQALSSGHERVVASVEENTRTLRLPVRPAYDKAGKLTHAQRDKLPGG